MCGSCLVLVACGESSTSNVASLAPASPSSASGSSTTCPDDPHAHVYSPDRLRLLVPCVTLIGTIELERAEPDGDFHVRLRLDAGQMCGGDPCINADNVSRQAGDLVLEPVCETPITQADAVAACQGYNNPLMVPPLGSYVAASGPFVLDLDHGWNEIHPLESIAALAAPAESRSPTPSSAPSPVALTVTITASRYGYLAAATSPGASCTAKAKLPSGRMSTAAGLQATMTAGDDGLVSWTYGTSSTTKPGTGTHTATCTYQGQTVSASAPFVVA